MAHIIVPPEFAGRVAKLIEDFGATELAGKADISRQTLYQWAKGSAPSSREQVEKLARAAGTTVEALIGREAITESWRALTIRRLRDLLAELEEGNLPAAPPTVHHRETIATAGKKEQKPTG